MPYKDKEKRKERSKRRRDLQRALRPLALNETNVPSPFHLKQKEEWLKGIDRLILECDEPEAVAWLQGIRKEVEKKKVFQTDFLTAQNWLRKHPKEEWPVSFDYEEVLSKWTEQWERRLETKYW